MEAFAPKTSTETNNPRGTYRVQDGSHVPFAGALTVWAEAAHAQLMTTAKRYQHTITYAELAEAVQQRSGVRTTMLMMHWIGQVLELVAIRCGSSGEPSLTSLCVHQDGTIGEGYAQTAKYFGDQVRGDIELYAANHRLACYRAYASDVPEGGGVPTLTVQVSQRRARIAAQREKPLDVCPRCWTALPATGICDNCS